MKSLLLFVCGILSSVSLSTRHAVLFMSNFDNPSGKKPKFCYNCRYFVSDGDTEEFARCSLFQTIYNKGPFLVSGVENTPTFVYTFCSTARIFNHLCGEEGNAHKRKYVKKSNSNSKITLESELDFDLETVLEKALEMRKMPKKI